VDDINNNILNIKLSLFISVKKLIQEWKQAGSIKTFIYDGDNFQLVQINKTCRWQSLQIVLEKQPKGMRGVDYTKENIVC
jgi:hypothetical protein